MLLWNPAAEALTGKAAAQMQGRSLWRTCPELRRYRDLFEQVLRECQTAHRRKEHLTTESGAVYRDVDVFPLLADDIEGAVLRIDDVTNRVRVEELMLQSAKMASVGRLATGVAHEINNPLSGMMQSTQILQLALDVNHPRTRERLEACGIDPDELGRYLQERGLVEYMDGILEAGGRAAKIVADPLSFSRKSFSQFALHDLNDLVEKALALLMTDYDLKRKYDFRDIEIVRELASDLPGVVCDGQQVQQVVLNLMHNAAHVMVEEKKKREFQPRLTLRTTHEQDWIRLEVEDNGPGIPEAVREHLFKPFFTTKEVGEGTGLGLWLCWSIVAERHHGRIWAERAASSGSRFVVELPLV